MPTNQPQFKEAMQNKLLAIFKIYDEMPPEMQGLLGTYDPHARWDMSKPFVRSGHIYATNGPVLARYPTHLPDSPDGEQRCPPALDHKTQFDRVVQDWTLASDLTCVKAQANRGRFYYARIGEFYISIFNWHLLQSQAYTWFESNPTPGNPIRWKMAADVDRGEIEGLVAHVAVNHSHVVAEMPQLEGVKQ